MKLVKPVLITEKMPHYVIVNTIGPKLMVTVNLVLIDVMDVSEQSILVPIVLETELIVQPAIALAATSKMEFLKSVQNVTVDVILVETMPMTV